jgi:TRAP-type C4-dicarboxylate transport system substrate-binding protein
VGKCAPLMRRHRSLVAGSLGALLLVGACGTEENSEGAAGANGDCEDVTLTFADSFPPGHVITVEGSEFFMERAEELAEGAVTFEHYPAEQLAAAPDLLDAAQEGIADIAYVGVAYVNDLPLSNVGTLPGSFTDPVKGTEAYWNLIQDRLLEEEYLPQEVRPLYATLLPPYNIATQDVKVETLDDLKGMTMRSSGGTMSRTLKALGGTPVEMPAPEVYQAMSRGTVDTWVGPPSSMPPYDLHEIVKYGTTNLNLGSFAGVFVINEGVWQELCADHQEALRTAGDETVTHLAEGIKAENDRVIEDYAARGIDMYELPEEEAERWNEVARSVWPEWAAEMDEKGLDGSGIVEDWRSHLDEVPE